MVCLRNISVDTLHKGDTDDDNDDNNNNNNIFWNNPKCDRLVHYTTRSVKPCLQSISIIS